MSEDEIIITSTSKWFSGKNYINSYWFHFGQINTNHFLLPLLKKLIGVVLNINLFFLSPSSVVNEFLLKPVGSVKKKTEHSLRDNQK